MDKTPNVYLFASHTFDGEESILFTGPPISQEEWRDLCNNLAQDVAKKILKKAKEKNISYVTGNGIWFGMLDGLKAKGFTVFKPISWAIPGDAIVNNWPKEYISMFNEILGNDLAEKIYVYNNAINNAIEEKIYRKIKLQQENKSGPCSPGCQGHVSHPCEKCGKQWGSK
ncbi:MAG: hypothetical protein WDA06_00885 [Phenylobacterium sp.]